MIDLTNHTSGTGDDSTPVPEELGRSYLSTKGSLGTFLLSDINDFESRDELETFQDVAFADDRSSFSRLMTFSARGKFNFSGGGSASARASMSRSFRKSKRSVDLVMYKVHHMKKYFVRDPKWRSEALETYRSDKAEFVKRYGDQYVKSVIVGGLLTVVYKLDFESMEEASDFRASFDASGGGASVGSSFHERMVAKAARSSISVRGIVSGVRNAPPVFQTQSGLDKETGEIRGNDPLATALLKYFDEFEEAVQRDNVAVPVVLAYESIFRMVNAGVPAFDLDLNNRALDEAEKLDDIIDEQMSMLEYCKAIARNWNPQISDEQLDLRMAELSQLSGTLLSEIDKIAVDQEFNGRLSLSPSDIPSIPDSWTLRKLRPVVEVVQRLVHRSYSGVLIVPLQREGCPIKVSIKAHMSDGPNSSPKDCHVVVYWEVNGQKVEILPMAKSVAEGVTHSQEDIFIYRSSHMSRIFVDGYSNGTGSISVVVSA